MILAPQAHHSGPQQGEAESATQPVDCLAIWFFVLCGYHGGELLVDDSGRRPHSTGCGENQR